MARRNDTAPANPLQHRSRYDLELSVETCQRILYRAMQSSNKIEIDSHQLFDIDELNETRMSITKSGWDAPEMHPLIVRQWFDGVTTDIVTYVEALYCQRLNRSPWAVNEIMAAQAKAASMPAVDPRAIWTLCEFFGERTRKYCGVTMEHQECEWYLDVIEPPIVVTDQQDRVYSPKLVVVLDTATPKVLAFRSSSLDAILRSLQACLYDAFVAQRRPSVTGAAGIEWSLPQAISVNLALPLSAAQDAMAELPECLLRRAPPDSANNKALYASLHHGWYESLRGQTISTAYLDMIFDNYLFRIQGAGPKRLAEERARQLGHLVGFNRDPADIFPALRRMLLKGGGRIATNGSIDFDGLSYAHEYLAHWPGREAILRQSAEAEAFAWIYFGDEVICKAAAKQLRRLDGSYRANRVRRM